MNLWLNNFAFKTKISLWLLICYGILALAVGLITVGWAAGKAARTNPAETLHKN